MGAVIAKIDSTKGSTTRFSADFASSTGRQSCCSRWKGLHPPDASYGVGVHAGAAGASASVVNATEASEAGPKADEELVRGKPSNRSCPYSSDIAGLRFASFTLEGEE